MRRSRATRQLCLAPLTITLALAGLVSLASAQTSEKLVSDRLLPMEVTVNNTQSGNWVLLERGGMLYAPTEAFDEWRVNRSPETPAISYRGQTWYPLNSVPGFKAQFDFSNQSVTLVFSPAAFAATRLSNETTDRPILSLTEPALFLNFDANLTSSVFRSAPTLHQLGALTELGFSSRWGVITSSYVAQNLSSAIPATPRSWRRLETTYNLDFPARNLSLRLGDSTTRSGLWGSSVYFGGMQLTRNFGLTPGFMSQPIPSLSGTASAPSTIELYVNDALRQTSNVPTGPFAIDNFPLITGGGNARIVVRDVLGRETVVVQPFFTHVDLLEQGLSDWSVEAGLVRRNLGSANAQYGQGFTSGMLRYGVSRNFTLDSRVELSAKMQNAGVGASYTLPWQTLGQAALVLSRDKSYGSGHQWMVNVQHDSLQNSFAARANSASRNYRHIGLDAGTLPNRLELSGNYSYSSNSRDSLGIAFARISTYDRGTLTSYSANYSMRLGNNNTLMLSATRVTGSSSGTSLGLSLTVPLDGQVVWASSLTTRSGQSEGYTSISKGLPSETGLGWRALSGIRDGAGYAEGGIYYQGNKTLLTADVSAAAAQQTVRLGAQGGLVFMDGRLFTSRRMQDSFALVEVPGYPNVGVGFQGSSLTRTDANGFALLPRLLPYQNNSIRLNPNELPISAELDTIEQIAVPAARSGVKVVFPVRTGRGALISIMFDDGQPAPAGAQIELVGDKQEFFVARRGEAFITGLQTKNSLRLKWNGASCNLNIELPPGNAEAIARLGPIICSAIKR
jgi:outer membrane usher protein